MGFLVESLQILIGLKQIESYRFWLGKKKNWDGKIEAALVIIICPCACAWVGGNWFTHTVFEIWIVGKEKKEMRRIFLFVLLCGLMECLFSFCHCQVKSGDGSGHTWRACFRRGSNGSPGLVCRTTWRQSKNNLNRSW